MATLSLEQRVAALESEMARLRERLEGQGPPADPWWENVWGAFANDPALHEAARLGREWRESFRPRSKSKRTPVA